MSSDDEDPRDGSLLPPDPKKEVEFKLIWRGEEKLGGFKPGFQPDLFEIGTRTLRFQTTDIVNRTRGGDGQWLFARHYKEFVAAVVSPGDLNLLTKIGSALTLDDLIDAFAEYPRLGPDSAIVGVLRTARADAALGAGVGYVKRLADFADHVPLAHQNVVRSVEFSDELVKMGQLSISGPANAPSLHGFIERADSSTLVLEIPGGQLVDTFVESGAMLTLNPTPLVRPIDLLEVKVRRMM